MFRMLIVDDEELIKNGLHSLIDWKAHDIEIIGTCSNGIDAYAFIMNEMPEFVITDIMMPGLTGLELIHAIKRHNLKTQFIVLSGYAEFSFAQKAMQDGVKYYILKPFNENDIISAINNCKHDLLQMGLLNISKSINRQTFFDLQRIAGKQLFSDLLSEKVPIPEILSRYSNEVEFRDTPYGFIEITGDMFTKEAISNLYSMIERENLISMFSILGCDGRLFLFFEDQTDDSLQQFLEQLEYPGKCYNFDNIHDMLKTIMVIVSECNDLFFYSRHGKKEAIVSHGYIIHQTQKIIAQLENLETDGFPEKLHCLITEHLSFAINMNVAITACISLITGLNLQYNFQLDLVEISSTLLKCRNIEEIFNETKNVILSEYQRINSERLRYSSQIIVSIEKAIQENLSNPDFSLKWLSENVIFMNVNYLSRLFQREKGTRFTYYVNHLRIEKAKSILLQNRNVKIGSIASEIGLGNNPQYFSQLFRKYTGMTPSQFIEAY